MNKIILACASALVLAACNQTTQMPNPSPVVTFPMPVVPKPAPLNLRDVEWKIYNRADIDELYAYLQANQDEGFVIFTVTADGYEALALNVNDLRRYIREQQEVILFLTNVLRERSNVGIVVR